MEAMSKKQIFQRVKQMLVSKKGIAGFWIIVIALILISHPEVVPDHSNHNLVWYAKVGDRLTYNVTYTNYSSTSDSYIDYGWTGLNQTPIVFEVFALPTIPDYLTADIFEEKVIVVTKVNCSRLDEQILPLGCAPFLNALVSQTILPVNDTVFLDSLYSDYDFEYHGTLPRGPEYFIQPESEEDAFLIGYMELMFFTYGHGGYGTGWYSIDNALMGYSEYVELTSFAPMSTGCIRDERITLVLVGYS